jgi:perosamine synthetase
VKVRLYVKGSNAAGKLLLPAACCPLLAIEITMRIGRVLPPTAAPLHWADLCNGLAAMVAPERALARFEDEVRRYFEVDHVFLVSSGTAALTLTLMALRSLSNRTEVLMPAYTCPSIPAAVLKAGLQPKLCDIDPGTLDFDHARFEEALTPETIAVVAHDLFGIRSDIGWIRAVCRSRGIAVIEDAAQAMGTEYKGDKLGTAGDVGIFSLGRGKTITCGAGGIIVTNAKPIADALAVQCSRLHSPALFDMLADFASVVIMALFIRPRLYWIPAALPWLRLGETTVPRAIVLARLSGMKAGLLRHWQRRLARSNRIRSRTVTYFSRRLRLAPPAGPSHPYLRLPIRVATPQEKARLYGESQARGLGLSVAYPAPLNEIPELRSAFPRQHFPSARHVADTLLTIPTHQWLSARDKSAIADCVAKGSFRLGTPWTKSRSGFLSRSSSTPISAIPSR